MERIMYFKKMFIVLSLVSSVSMANSNLSNSPLFLQGSGAVPMNVVQMKNVQGANFFDGFLKGFLIGTRAVFDDAYDIEYVVDTVQGKKFDVYRDYFF
jgi:hypothetical protein